MFASIASLRPVGISREVPNHVIMSRLQREAEWGSLILKFRQALADRNDAEVEELLSDASKTLQENDDVQENEYMYTGMESSLWKALLGTLLTTCEPIYSLTVLEALLLLHLPCGSFVGEKTEFKLSHRLSCLRCACTLVLESRTSDYFAKSLLHVDRTFPDMTHDEVEEKLRKGPTERHRTMASVFSEAATNNIVLRVLGNRTSVLSRPEPDVDIEGKGKADSKEEEGLSDLVDMFRQKIVSKKDPWDEYTPHAFDNIVEHEEYILMVKKRIERRDQYELDCGVVTRKKMESAHFSLPDPVVKEAKIDKYERVRNKHGNMVTVYRGYQDEGVDTSTNIMFEWSDKKAKRAVARDIKKFTDQYIRNQLKEEERLSMAKAGGKGGKFKGFHGEGELLQARTIKGRINPDIGLLSAMDGKEDQQYDEMTDKILQTPTAFTKDGLPTGNLRMALTHQVPLFAEHFSGGDRMEQHHAYMRVMAIIASAVSYLTHEGEITDADSVKNILYSSVLALCCEENFNCIHRVDRYSPIFRLHPYICGAAYKTRPYEDMLQLQV